MARQHYVPKNEIKAFSRRSDLVGALLVLHCWGTVLLMMAMFVIWPNPLTFFTAFWIISGRQLGIAILMHDTSHGLLFKSEKLNAFVGQYLLAIFVGADMPVYRKYHLRHHLYTQQENDPDLGLSAPFPITKQSFMRKMLRDLFGLTAFKLRVGQLHAAFRNLSDGEAADQAFNVQNIIAPYAANIILFLVFSLAGYWWLYLALWVLPLFTGFQLVLRIRNIAEHAMTSTNDNPLTHARTTKANLIERLLFAPYWVNYHVEHHAYMYIPCWQLKNLHLAMKRKGHANNMEMKNSYIAVLRSVITV